MVQKVVLSLDGGGVRGKFSFGMCNLLALASEKPLSKVFDLILGVSVGSFIGAVIAFGMLDDKQTQTSIYNHIYAEMIDIFRAKNDFGLLLAPRYDGIGKRATLRRIFGQKTLGEVKTPFAVVCATMGGRPHVFKSWDKIHSQISVVDVLDASSAVPIYFPPVQIGNRHFIDGGVRANKPLILTYLCATELFGTHQFKILSIGTQATCELKISAEDVKNAGAISWIGYGLIDILTGIADDTEVLLMDELLGPYNFRRIYCDCGKIALDDMSAKSDSDLQDAIANKWQNSGDKLLEFIS